MRRIINYLNPLARLGIRRYSILVPLCFTLFVYFLSEVYLNFIVKDLESVGTYIIFISTALIMFFSFRDGIRGGYIATSVTTAYYLFLVSRQDDAQGVDRAIKTIIILTLLFLILSFVIGWLKQKIDELIESEANEKRRLQTIIWQLPVGVVITDKNGIVVEVNPKAEALIGRKILTGSNITTNDEHNATDKDISTPVLSINSPLVRALATSESVLGEEFLINHSDGSSTHLQVSASPIHNSNGRIIAAATIINDITQQKEIEALKDEFIGIASHELKTPLTTIKGYTQILGRLLEKFENPKAISYLHKTNKYIDRLSTLISDLLDVSKIQAGKIEFNYDYYDFDAMVEECLFSFQEFNSTFTITRKGLVKQKVYGDASRTEQVLSNLLSNAMKYSPDGKKIEVKVSTTKKDVTVSVKDYGIGIAKEDQLDIFSRFYRVESNTEKFSGLGIGLYISSEIIHRQGGKIWVESQTGKGSTFFFSLPIRAPKTIIVSKHNE